jgi:adenine-specific DNA-methyltransferase
MLYFARHLRRNQTEAEQRLWYFFRARRFDDHKFRRQKPMGPYVVDFCCVKARLIIEIDGGQHAERTKADQERTNYLNRQGFRVIRFWNHDVLDRTEYVLQEIWRALQPPSPRPLPPQKTWEEREPSA